MPRLRNPLILLLCLAAVPAFGQSSVIDSTHPQAQSRDQAQRRSSDRNQEVQAGAGTTAETTTGSSGAAGPSEPSADEQGEGGGATQQAQDQPPDPATVCDDLRNQAIRQQCIEKAER